MSLDLSTAAATMPWAVPFPEWFHEHGFGRAAAVFVDVEGRYPAACQPSTVGTTTVLTVVPSTHAADDACAAQDLQLGIECQVTSTSES